jgi:[ribosomal protein S5]-alanine N-acetyltransferase
MYISSENQPLVLCNCLQNFPKIQGLHINLRELSGDDVPDITMLMTRKIAKFLWDIPYPYTRENALEFVNSSKRTFKSLEAVNLAIEYNSDFETRKKVIGTISLKNINLTTKVSHIGYWLGEQYWGMGLGTESVCLVINYAFSAIGLEKICAFVYPDNKGSIRVLEKSGFKIGGQVNEYHKISGTYRNSLIYVIQNTRQ